MQPRGAALALHLHAVRRWPVGVLWDDRSEAFREVGERFAVGVNVPIIGPPRIANWFTTLGLYEEFWWLHRRTPREKTRNPATLPGEERRLAEWARRQRRSAPQLYTHIPRSAQKLCTYQVLRLDVSPAFAWQAQQAAWDAMLESCERHRRRTGALPRLNGDSAEEFALARWLGRQLRQLQHGGLNEERDAKVRALLADAGAIFGVLPD